MDLDTLLAETAQVPDVSSAALAEARHRMEQSFPPVQLIAVRRRRRRRALTTGLVAAAASLVLVAAPTLSGNPHDQAAAQVLKQAGASAGAQAGDWKDAAYWHSVSRYTGAQGTTFRREIWIGHDRNGSLKDPGVDAGVVIPLGEGIFPAGAGGIDWDGLWDLPTDPKALDKVLRSGINGAGPDDDSEMFVIVGDLLRESPAPPALRKALWEVAATIPGIELVGEVTDHAGRGGVAVERHGTRYVLDPSDGRLLEEGSGDWQTTYLEQGPADTAPTADADWGTRKPGDAVRIGPDGLVVPPPANG
jgi:hypothetical protein